ncbi:MAG: IS110 family transposase [Actinomycetes bacterium]
MLLDQAWVGVDVGKDHHWAAAVDADGQVLVSRKVANDQWAILGVLAEAAALARRLVWTVDLTTAEAARLLAVLWGQGQQVRYLAGRAVSQAAVGYRGEGKTDAKDARSIADQSRMRRDLPELRPGQDLVVELRILTSRRADLVGDRTRAINRLRQQLTAICPALERAAELAGQRGWVVLVAHDQRPGDLRSLGVAALAGLLAGHGNADRIAQAAVAAASTQTVDLPGQDVAAGVAGALAAEVLDLGARITQTDHALQERFGRHPLAEVIASMPGFGFRLGAELLAAIGQLELIGSADRLAAYAGLSPVANDSGKRTGRLRTPRRYHRALRRAMYLAALTAIRCSSQDRAYYQRKRAEGKRHVQAVICLARRRTNVLWALLGDHRTWEPQPPVNHQAA